MKLSKASKWALVIILAPLGMALFVYLGGEIIMRLWNWLLPPLFGWPQITFWQGLGLLALCRILFGGFGTHGGSTPRPKSRTPAERERFRRAMCERWGVDKPPEPVSPEGSGE